MTNRLKPSGAGFSLRGTLVPQVQWRTEVRRRLKSAPHGPLRTVTVLEPQPRRLSDAH